MEANHLVQTINVLTERFGKEKAKHELEIAELWTEIFKLRSERAEAAFEPETKTTKK